MTTKKTAFAPVKTKRNPQLKKVTGFIKLHRHSQAETEFYKLHCHHGKKLVVALDFLRELIHIRILVKPDGADRVPGSLESLSDDVPILNSLAVVENDLWNPREHGEKNPCVGTGDTDAHAQLIVHIVVHLMLNSTDTEHLCVLAHSRHVH